MKQLPVSLFAIIISHLLISCEDSPTQINSQNTMPAFDTTYIDVPNFSLTPSNGSGWHTTIMTNTYIHDSGSYGILTSNPVLLGDKTYKFVWKSSKYITISIPQLTGVLPTKIGEMTLKMDMTSPLTLASSYADTLTFTAKLQVLTKKQ